jgi:two-component system cell cycle sensor histidine kinase/response regulator CckA
VLKPELLPHLYLELVENAPEAIIVVSNGKLVFANAVAKALVGLPASTTVADHHVLEFVHQDSRDRVTKLIEVLHNRGGSASMVEVTLAPVDGIQREVELMSHPMTHEGSAASVVFVRDVTDRKKTERALRSSEARYRLVVDSMNEALVVYDADKRVQFVNRQFCTLFERTADEVIGGVPFDTLSPETAAFVDSRLEMRRKGVDERYEAELTTRSGKTISAQISAAPLVDEGNFSGSVALITDITGHKEATVALERSEHRYRELLNNLPHYVFSLDRDDRYVTVNRAVCEFFGLTESEIIGRTAVEIGIPTEMTRQWAEQNAQTRATGKAATSEGAVMIRGRLHQFRAITTPFRDAHGTIVGVTGVSIDTTEQKAAENTVNSLLRAVEQLDEVMFTTDRDGAITYVNPAFEKVYGYSREEVVGKTPRIIKGGELPADHYTQLWSDLLAGRSVRSEYRNRRKDGSLVDVVASASPVVDDAGSLTGFIAVQQDITAQKRAAEERQRLDERLGRVVKLEALGTLAGGLAHDFNNILSIILSHASLLEKSVGDPARVTSTVATLKQAVQRGAALSRQILTFARKTEFRTEQINLANLVMEAGSMISETFPRTIQVTLDLDPDVPPFSGDSGQLHQALLNLCVNARDAMPNGGDLTIAVQLVPTESIKDPLADAKSDYVCITVTDTGVGMDDVTRRRVFEPFFTTKGVGKGTGLGLAVVYGVVNNHGGLIDVESQLGRGTKFRLYFPIVLRATSITRDEPSVKISGGIETLLVIDDEPAIRAALEMQLSEVGYQVLTAANGPEGIEICKRAGKTLGAVIMDLGMPKMSAVDLLKALHDLAPEVPVIAMTGYVDSEVHASVASDGVKRILQKPFEIDALLRCLSEVLPRLSSGALPMR